MQEPPGASGIGLASWNWRAVCQFVLECFGVSLSRSSCLNYLHRLGFAFKRPKKRLLKADVGKAGGLCGRVRFLGGGGAGERGEDILRRRGSTSGRTPSCGARWVLRGEPAPRFHEGRLW